MSKQRTKGSPLDRVLKAIAYSKPDKVPIIFFPEWDFLADFAGVKVKKFLNNVELQVETNQKFKDRFPDVYCAVSVYQPYAQAQAFGCPLSDPDDEIPMVAKNLLNTTAEVESLKIPDPWSASGTSRWLENVQYQVESGFESAGIGDFGPLEVAGQLYKYDRLIRDMRKNPATIHTLLEKCNEFIVKFLSEWAKILGGRATVTLIADHVSGFMNNKSIDTFFSPYHTQLLEQLKPFSSILFYHSENRSDHIIDQIGKWGYNMFHGMDWAPKGDLRKTKEIVSGLGPYRYALVGQVPGRDIILREPSNEIVAQKIIENIQIYAPGSGYILSTGGGINRGTPLHRLDLMVELVNKYGRYKSKKVLYAPNET
ncbi:MAG: uroporphyrinogen decarboxylase family protein [Candidatus Helarchaeota archaeon]